MTQPDPSAVLSQFLGSLPTFIAVILAWMHSNASITDVKTGLNQRIDDLQNTLSRRIDDTRDLLRAEFRRVEEVMDARLRHLEERER